MGGATECGDPPTSASLPQVGPHLSPPHPGYEWVAWSNDTLRGEDLLITCFFDAVRSFQGLSIHASNQHSRGAAVSVQLDATVHPLSE